MTTPTDPLDALTGIASSHPQWSSTDAGGIPALLTRIDALEADNARLRAENAELVIDYADLVIIAAGTGNALSDLRDAADAVLEGDADGMERLRAARKGRE